MRESENIFETWLWEMNGQVDKFKRENNDNLFNHTKEKYEHVCVVCGGVKEPQILKSRKIQSTSNRQMYTVYINCYQTKPSCKQLWTLFTKSFYFCLVFFSISFVPHIEFVVFCSVYCFNFFLSFCLNTLCVYMCVRHCTILQFFGFVCHHHHIVL